MADDMPSGLVIFALGFGVMLGFILLLWAVNVLPHKLREIMSRPIAQLPAKLISEPVHVPVRETSTAAVPAAEQKPVLADTDAENASTDWELPRISRHLSERDIITMLAAQKDATKWRYSANQIHTLVGGPRAEVLAIVRELRDPPAEFRPLTPEQQAQRQALGLEGK